MKPNIIVCFSEQLRYDTVGCYNKELDITPNLDYMASEGVKFENTIKVPLIIYGPGFKGGKIVNELASLIDIPKTIVELGKGKVPKSMRGESLLELANEGLKEMKYLYK